MKEGRGLFGSSVQELRDVAQPLGDSKGAAT